MSAPYWIKPAPTKMEVLNIVRHLVFWETMLELDFWPHVRTPDVKSTRGRFLFFLDDFL